MVNTEEVKALFMQGIDCSQVVAGAMAEKVSMDEKQLRRMAACFGGGMMCGETCGAVTGALMILGLKYGHDTEGDTVQKSTMQEWVTAFKQAFLKKYPSDICRELLGHDISKPGEMEKVLEEGTMFTLCPCIVRDVIAILEEELA